MRVFTVLTMCALVLSGSLAAQAYRLQYNDTAGATRTYQSEFTMKGSMDAAGMGAIPIETVSKFTTLETVQKIADGKASIETKMKEGSIVSRINGQAMNQPMPAFLITFDRTPRGEISNVKAQNTAPSGVTAMPGGDSQLQYLNQVTGVGEFPDKDLKIGDSWTTTDSIEVLGGTKIEVMSTNKLTGVKMVDGKTYLVIETDMAMKMPSQPINFNAMGQNITIHTYMQMQGKSSSLFDEAAGEFFRTTFTGNMTMTMSTGDGTEGGFSSSTTMAVTGATAKK